MANPWGRLYQLGLAANHVMDEKINRVEMKIDGVEKAMNAKIDGVGKRLDKKIDGLEKKLDELKWLIIRGHHR